ncbi:thioredoxin-like [Tubulanus polymorphus]|uniref:thioredoxin-like n=1 Tax=Tubulanus polymorphus TaxID=672921 RepID=UPI003DA60D66
MGVITIESEEEFDQALEDAGNKLVVVDFWAEWCGPCRMIGPHFHRWSNDSAFKDVVFLKIDVDELSDLAEKIGISCMPTFIFFRHGKKKEELSGANKDMLRAKIEELKK